MKIDGNKGGGGGYRKIDEKKDRIFFQRYLKTERKTRNSWERKIGSREVNENKKIGKLNGIQERVEKIKQVN